MSKLMTTLKRRSAEWNALDAKLTALWEKNGKPQGEAWKKIASPLWGRIRKVEDALEPLLFKWALDNNMVGNTWLHLRGGGYAKLRAETGLKMNWQGILRLATIEHEKQKDASLDELARTMPEKKWVKYMDEFCTLSPEGQNTKDYLLKARERHHLK